MNPIFRKPQPVHKPYGTFNTSTQNIATNQQMLSGSFSKQYQSNKMQYSGNGGGIFTKRQGGILVVFTYAAQSYLGLEMLQVVERDQDLQYTNRQDL